MRPLALALLLPLAAACTPDGPPADGTPADGAAVETRMVTDDSSGVALPRVTLPGRPEAEARVNAALDSLAASLWCGSDAFPDGGPAPGDSSWTNRIRIDHAADDVLSLNIHSAYFCNTAYPTNDANGSVTYDLTTGAAVPFRALFRDYDADRDAIAGLLSATLTPAAAGDDAASGDAEREEAEREEAEREAAEREEAAGRGAAGAARESAAGEVAVGETAEDEGCAALLTPAALADAEFAYSLGDAGMTVQPVFPHVTEACAVEATIPYGSVAAFAADGGVLARVARAAGGQAGG